jgi:hypothetical protein
MLAAMKFNSFGSLPASTILSSLSFPDLLIPMAAAAAPRTGMARSAL